jgi:hypothetical protein
MIWRSARKRNRLCAALINTDEPHLVDNQLNKGPRNFAEASRYFDPVSK